MERHAVIKYNIITICVWAEEGKEKCQKESWPQAMKASIWNIPVRPWRTFIRDWHKVYNEFDWPTCSGRSVCLQMNACVRRTGCEQNIKRSRGPEYSDSLLKTTDLTPWGGAREVWNTGRSVVNQPALSVCANESFWRVEEQWHGTICMFILSHLAIPCNRSVRVSAYVPQRQHRPKCVCLNIFKLDAQRKCMWCTAQNTLKAKTP